MLGQSQDHLIKTVGPAGIESQQWIQVRLTKKDDYEKSLPPDQTQEISTVIVITSEILPACSCRILYLLSK